MLADLLRQLLERNVPMEVVARIAGPDRLAAVSRTEQADLALLCMPSEIGAATVERLGREIGPTALVVVEHRGRAAWCRMPEPGLSDLVRMIALLCRAPRGPFGVGG